VLAVGGLVAPAPASAAADFRTPNKAAYCRIAHGGAVLVCWTPNDGFTVRMGRRRRPSTAYVLGHQGFQPRVRRVLRFGDRWRRSGFRCASRRSGLTCRNRAGHGWWLGRRFGYRPL
jgi:hypothetical protein